MPPQGRPQAAGRSSQFQPGKYEIFPGRGMSNQKASQKPARSQPEANQTSFFDSQKPAKSGKQRPDLARQPGPCRELIVQPSSGRPRRSTPGLLRQPTRGTPRQQGGPASFSQVSMRFFQARGCPTRKPASQPEANQTSFFDSQSKAAWALQGVNTAAFFRTASQAHTWNCAICFASFVGGAVPPQGLRQQGGPASFSQVSTRFFEAGGCPTRKPARSQPEANQTSFFDSQKPAKPGKQRPDLARRVNSAAFFGTSKAIDAWAASQAHAWNCAIYFASFVGGAVPPQGRPQAAGRSSQFQPGKYEIFPGGGCPTRKLATTQPEANQTSFFDSQKPAKPGKQRPDLARQPGPELIVQPFSGRPRRSTPGLLRKPTRGIVPSTLLRLWEGQCLHKAAPGSGEVQPVSAR